MQYRKLGKTNLLVSEIGFGSWAIGGPLMAGDVPIGWGEVNDDISKKAILKAVELGVNFFDTADFYGLGHSEELLGNVFDGKWNDIILATKVGNALMPDGSAGTDYSKKYIIQACEKSLKRLKKDAIDVYQLHSARIEHLEHGECIEAMEQLQREGKIRYWGISLNTFQPQREAKFFVEHQIGHTFQIAFSIVNQIALREVFPLAIENNYGIIARVPLHFGLLTGKFSREKVFPKNDHRSNRLNPELLNLSLDKLEKVFELANAKGVKPVDFAMGFILSHPAVSTVIPGIRTEAQAIANAKEFAPLTSEDVDFLHSYYSSDLELLMDAYKKG
ncbi:MAG: aldo/keto reductase [Ignavibacteriaceae bacterium]|jgi:aryl-alcohol dehydrogenase-like predicted oxidoreductase